MARPASTVRDKGWNLLNDRDGRVAALDIELDCLDMEIDTLHRIRYEENKTRLERLGIDTSHYRPPPRRLRSEQRCLNHLDPNDDVEAIVAAAQEMELARTYREHIAARENLHLEPGDKLLYGDGRLIRPYFDNVPIVMR